MLIKPRQVRRSSKFTSRLKTGSRQRREYAASTVTMAAVEAILAVVMIVAGVRAFQAIHAQAPSLSFAVKLALPLLFLLGSLLSIRACIKNVRAVRELNADKTRPPTE
jgi:ABC-type siderophore export system fused ATPase/permease subunit